MATPSQTPPSPCNRNCTLDPDTDICLGCYRRLEEILGWSNYSSERKLAVLEKLADRKKEFLRERSTPPAPATDAE